MVLFKIFCKKNMQYQQKYKNLQERLQKLPTLPPSTSTPKLKILQNTTHRLLAAYQEEQMNQEYQIKSIQERCGMLEGFIREHSERFAMKGDSLKMRVLKCEKVMEKIIEKMAKDRRETDHKIQHALEGYLMELTSNKIKVQSGCHILLKQFNQLQKSIEEADKTLQTNTLTTNQVVQKIYTQFSHQIEQLHQMLRQEEKTQRKQEEKAIEILEKVYCRMESRLKALRAERQRNEKEVIELLEGVVEKISGELLRQ